jgi:UDP-N-acetylglucosamine 1-carboxyvinyltransferase
MDELIIEGGRRLKGTVTVSGAKNAALPLMAATILAPGKHILSNVPEVADLRTMKKLLSFIGAEVTGEHPIHIDSTGMTEYEAPYDIVKTMRASSLVLGPLLARFGRARVSMPGGCAIGARPLNLHLKALEQMGADITLAEGYIEAKAKRLKGATISFDHVTVTGTENIMMAATAAKGTTIIENAAKEPEVANLADYLRSMGAHIEGEGTDVITIEGTDALTAGEERIIPDRIEAGTFLVAAALTGSSIRIENCEPKHLTTLIHKLEEAGVTFEIGDDYIVPNAPRRLTATNATTAPHPGFATDLQAQFMAAMTLAEGTSIVTETIFENRFMHVSELCRLGADITIEGSSAIIKGVKRLKGAPVMATDLRASASLVIAALVASGETRIQRIYHLDRGYAHIDEKLTSLGARITRVPSL